MLVTINTDASFMSQENKGAYAFWIKSNNGLITRSGVFKDQQKHPTECEFKAVLNALHHLFNYTSWKKIDRIIINSDSEQVVNMINGAKTAEWAIELKKLFDKIITEKNVLVLAKKVKAHHRNIDSRHFVNNWCDQRAKIALREHVKKEKSSN